MKSALMMNAVVAALAIAASADVQAVTVRTDLDADTRARLELLERMRASRGIRYFNTSNPMPAPVVVQAAPVTQLVTLPAQPPAPAAPANCIPAGQAPAAAPAPPAPAQSVSYEQQTIAGSPGTAPAYSLMSRVSPGAASRSRGSVLQALFDARSLRLYGVAPGQAAVTTITPVVTVSQAAPAPAAPSLPVCQPAESAKPDGGSNSQAGAPPTGPSEPLADNGASDPDPADAPPPAAGTTPDAENPFLAEDLLPGFGTPDEAPAGSADSQSGDDGAGGTNGGSDNDGSGGDNVVNAFASLAAPPADVPEPGSLALLGLGLIGLGAARRGRR